MLQTVTAALLCLLVIGSVDAMCNEAQKSFDLVKNKCAELVARSGVKNTPGFVKSDSTCVKVVSGLQKLNPSSYQKCVTSCEGLCTLSPTPAVVSDARSMCKYSCKEAVAGISSSGEACETNLWHLAGIISAGLLVLIFSTNVYRHQL